jgi:hypothetical protein
LTLAVDEKEPWRRRCFLQAKRRFYRAYFDDGGADVRPRAAW